MKVVSFELGKVTYLYSPDEVRPRRGVSPLELIKGISERYKFANQPGLPQDGQGGVRFQHGVFETQEGAIYILGFSLFNDALIVETYSTDQSLLVLDDAIEWARNEFGLQMPQTPPRIFFESSLVVEFKGDISTVLVTFDLLRRGLGDAMEQLYEHKFQIGFQGFALAADTSELPSRFVPFLKTDLTIVRRVNRPLSENRYFSVSPLKTDDHVALLEKFEKAAISKRTTNPVS